MLLDTHVHLIDRSILRYEWIDDVPALNHDATLADYTRQAQQLGISRSIHMEVDVVESDMEKEADWVGDMIQQPQSQLVAAIAACRPESSDFESCLERMNDRPWVRGFRRVLHVAEEKTSTSSLFRSNVRKLADSGHVFDICMRADQLTEAAELVDACPNVQFVLDHCGVPNIKDAELDPWREHITDLARRENVAAKISGVIAYGNGTEWRLTDIEPFVLHVVDAFGWDRIVWGSDSPVCTLGGPLSSWVAATHTLFASVSMDERSKLYSANAERIWGLQAG